MYNLIHKTVFKEIEAAAIGNRISTTDLVDRIYNFCEVYSGRTLYKYQTQFAKRVIRSVLENDGAEITALFSRQSGKSETIAVVSGGLMIILPTLANMPMFSDDRRFMMYKDGVWIGIFAPSQRQAQITYGRMKSKLQSPTSVAILDDPEFNLFFSTSNGQTVRLSNGSFATAISASDGSNIEGESFKIIICEECLLAGNKIFTENGEAPVEKVKVGDRVLSFNHTTQNFEFKEVVRAFSQPLYKRKIVSITTESGKVLKCTDNHKIFIPKKDEYVRADTLQIGDLVLSYCYEAQEEEKCDEIKSSSIGKSVRGWVSIIPHKAVKKSKVHFKSVFKPQRFCRLSIFSNRKGAFYPRTSSRKKFGVWGLCISCCIKMRTYLEKLSRDVLCRNKKSSKRVNNLSNGSRSISSLVYGEWVDVRNDVHTHASFFVRGTKTFNSVFKRKVLNKLSNSRGQKSTQVFPLFLGKRQKQISETNRALYNTNDAVQAPLYGYRKCLSYLWKILCPLPRKKKCSLQPRVRKNSGKKLCEKLLPRSFKEERIVSITVEEYPEIKVYDLTVKDNHNFFAEDVLVHNCQDISNYKLGKSISPMGAAYNATTIKIGTATTYKGNFYEAIQRNKKEYQEGRLRVKNHFEYDYTVVQKYNPNYAKYIEREKKTLGENSDAFRMSYKLEWIFSRGMFVDINEFEIRNGDDLLDYVYSDTYNNHVVGIDIGGGGDKKSGDLDSTVISVVEVDWNSPAVVETSYNEETGQDETFIAYDTRLVAQEEISGEIAEDYEEQYHLIMEYLKRFKISKLVIDATKESSLAQRIRANVKYPVEAFVFSSKSKSDLYKNFENEINTGRFKYPNSVSAKETKEHQKFTYQMSELQKGYRGSYLVVAHPPEKGAHDDYPDSTALALWGAKTPTTPDETETGDFMSVFGNRASYNIRYNSPQQLRNRYTAMRRR